MSRILKKYIDEYFPILFLYGMCAYFLLDTEEFTPDSLYYPRGLTWILLALATALLVATLLKKIKLPKAKDEKVVRKFGIIFVSSLVYVAALPFLGFVVSSLLYCPTAALTLGYKRKGMALCVSIVTVALIYVGFRMLLKVPIPTTTIFGITI